MSAETRYMAKTTIALALALAIIVVCLCAETAISEERVDGRRANANVCAIASRAGAEYISPTISDGDDKTPKTRKYVSITCALSSDGVSRVSNIRCERKPERVMRAYIVYGICNPMHAPPTHSTANG